MVLIPRLHLTFLKIILSIHAYLNVYNLVHVLHRKNDPESGSQNRIKDLKFEICFKNNILECLCFWKKKKEAAKIYVEDLKAEAWSKTGERCIFASALVLGKCRFLSR